MILKLSFLFLLQNVLVQSAQKITFKVSKSYTNNIFLYYYKGPTLNDHIIIKLENGLSLTQQKDFDIGSTTVFYFPGFGENAYNGSAATVVSAFLPQKICNIVVFDYSALIQNIHFVTYPIAALNVSNIGKAIGEFFKAYTPFKQPIKLIKLVSHSLGSQIMAKVARIYGIGKLERLTGLDPAGPIYNIPGIKHLDKYDGKFVDIIHTDAWMYGDGRTIGTVDFFPNRGTRVQRGCKYIGFCSHMRSYQYYAESIINPKAFLGKLCVRILFVDYFCCNANKVAYMGYYVNTSVHGTFFLTTNGQSPFGKGQNGIDF